MCVCKFSFFPGMKFHAVTSVFSFGGSRVWKIQMMMGTKRKVEALFVSATRVENGVIMEERVCVKEIKKVGFIKETVRNDLWRLVPRCVPEDKKSTHQVIHAEILLTPFYSRKALHGGRDENAARRMYGMIVGREKVEVKQEGIYVCKNICKKKR